MPKVDIVFNARTEGFSRGMDKLRAELNKTGQDLEKAPFIGRLRDALVNPVTAATAAAAGFVKIMRSVVVDAERLRDISTRIAGTLRDAQGLRHGASMTGVDEARLVQTVAELRKSTGEALGGSRDKVRAFQELGITVERLSAASPVELLSQVLSKFSEGEISARQFAAATKLLGNSFEDLLAASKRGLGQHMVAPGFAPRPQDLRAAEQVGQNVRGTWAGVKTGWNWLGTTTLSGLLGLSRLARGVTWGSADLLGVPGAAERRDAALLSRELQFGPDQQTNMDRLSAQLMRQRQARDYLGTLRDQNRLAGGGLAFEQLPLGGQLEVLQGVYNRGAGAMKGLSKVEQEQQTAVLIELQRDILKVQMQIARELEKMNYPD